MAWGTLFQRHLIGIYWADSLDVLKLRLFQAGETESPCESLDVVMVEDVDHFFELLAEHGVPLALAQTKPQ